MKISKLYLTVLISAVILLFGLTSCTPGGSDAETEPQTQAETQAEQTSEGTTERETHTKTETTVEPETEAETEEPYIVNTHYEASEAGAAGDKIIQISDYGAIGDGKADDADAVCRAFNDAIAQHATLQFESGKTYRLSAGTNNGGSFRGPLTAEDISGVTIDGMGCTFLMEPGVSFFAFDNCSNIKLTNCTFDTAVSVYLVGKVKSVSGTTVVYTVNEEPNASSYNYEVVNGFSIAYNEGIQNRPHRFLKSMTQTASKEVRAEYQSSPDVSVGDLVFLPNPGIGHVYGEVIDIYSCSGAMVFENVNIRQAPSFVFAIKNNDAEIYFENVNILPDENDGREIHMVSWRDGYHCKDNRGAIHWNECDVGVIFDDVFNISNTLGYVTAVSSNGNFSVCNYELQSIGQLTGYDCKVGDVVDVFNQSKGTYCGSATVREVSTNPDGTTLLVLGYGDSLEKLSKGCVVADRNTCAPGSTITNCKFTGTYRFKRDLRVENCTFDNLATWIMVEGNVEGAVPGNIDFINCTFNGGEIQIDSLNRETNKYMKNISKAITDIGFWGCKFQNGAEIFSKTSVKPTVSDTWSEETLFTVKNKRSNAVIPAEISPSEEDFKRGVTYDWTYFTMPVSGAESKLIDKIADVTARTALQTAFAGRVLIPTDENVGLIGLAKDKLPFLYKAGNCYTITVKLYVAEDCTVGLMLGSSEIGTAAVKGGKTASIPFIYTADGQSDRLSLSVKTSGTVYIGKISISTADNRNPSTDQLRNAHTFIWDGRVTVEGGTAMDIDEIPDETVKTAIKGAESGFTTGRVLRLNGEFEDFTGLTDSSYYAPGTSYHITIDAYIASAMVKSSDMKIYLLSMDDTAGNRVLAEGLFEGEGFWHFETDWYVGNTGEYSLKFFFNKNPQAYADIYLGNFTISSSGSIRPTVFDTSDSYYTPTLNELKGGYTFDFTDGNLLDTGEKQYALLSSMDEKVSDKLTGYGFGKRVYYCNCNFHLNSISNYVGTGRGFVIKMQVYDVVGNLANTLPRGAMVLLQMSGGRQNSAEINYTVETDSRDSRLLTITFNCNPPQGTDDFLMYQLAPIEFIIGSVTVTLK